jgi:prefoldin subunit 4
VTSHKMAAKSTQEIGNDMVVLYEDQQKINLFAKKNSQLNDIKDQITDKERIYQNVEDAADELILVDDDQLIPYPNPNGHHYIPFIKHIPIP